MIRIKRLGISVSLNSGSSPPLDSAYWPRARTAFLKQFQPIGLRYRRRKRIGLYLFIAFMSLGFATSYFNFPETLRFYCFIFLVTAWLVVVLIFIFGMKLRCPACRKRLEPAKGRYCPQCGSDQFHGDVHWRPLIHRDQHCSMGGALDASA